MMTRRDRSDSVAEVERSRSSDHLRQTGQATKSAIQISFEGGTSKRAGARRWPHDGGDTMPEIVVAILKYAAYGVCAIIVLVAYLWGLSNMPRSIHTIWRRFAHLFLPIGAFVALINGAWQVSLAALAVWLVLLALTPLYIARIERPSERKQAIGNAKLGLTPVLYLRPFAGDAALRGIEELLREATESLRFENDQSLQFNPVALGIDDRQGFPKAVTSDETWWQEFVGLAESAMAIILLPAAPDATAESGLVREIAHVFQRCPEKVLVVVPPLASWAQLGMGRSSGADARDEWGSLGDVLRKLRPSSKLPDLDADGMLLHLVAAGDGGARWRFYPLTPGAVQSALDSVTAVQRAERRQAWKEFTDEFKVRNGISYEEYRTGGPKKHPGVDPLY
jgi:hypothetical protein